MTEANWPQIAEVERAEEGGYVNNLHDPGRATKYGVTIGELAVWRKRPVTVADVQNLTWAEASEILKTQYFDKVRGDLLPAGLDLAVTDAAVNSGPVRAIMWLQRAVGVEVDGCFGIITAHAVAGINDVDALIERYDAARLGFLRHLRTWPWFRRGWFARVNFITAKSKAMAVA